MDPSIVQIGSTQVPFMLKSIPFENLDYEDDLHHSREFKVNQNKTINPKVIKNSLKKQDYSNEELPKIERRAI